jgi:2-keto-4-pentenoate hydratase/2-oxohepta-3-ene-1,7-dioic acid hydratase in catechol pathway
MKLISFLNKGVRSYGAVFDDQIIDWGHRYGLEYPTLRTSITADFMKHLSQESTSGFGNPKLADVTLLPPIIDPQKIICVGLNYKAHAEEAGFKIPEFPSVFMRTTSTLVAHQEPMQRPRISNDFDYEGELAVIIGKPGRHIQVSDAMDHVFGYTCFNDGSVRDIQFQHSLIAGKNFPATGALGPWIVTADEIPDPSKLTLTTRVNGREVQRKGVDDMIFNVAQIISYISSWTRLEAGDVIATGTPEGVGFARKPPLWLKPGDSVEVEISGIGKLVNSVIAES